MKGKNKKIGVLFPPTAHGGTFQYSLGLTASIASCRGNVYEPVVFHSIEGIEGSFKGVDGVTFVRLGAQDLFTRLFKGVRLFTGAPSNAVSRYLKERLVTTPVDLLIIPYPSAFGIYSGIPYILCIHDIMHKYYPGFPEFTAKERVLREIVYGKTSRNSLFTVVDSGRGKEDLVRFYGVEEERVRVVPFIPPPYVFEYGAMNAEVAREVLAKYPIPRDFVFYPAQLWHHKNHARLFEALVLVKERYGERVDVVLTGDSKGNYGKVSSTAKTLGIDGQVHFLGYVPEKEAVALYKLARALVYPTLFGPTNIPPLEAFYLGTPVVCSNLFEMPAQAGGAALLFDPFDAGDMAEKIHMVWKDGALREELSRKGLERAKSFTMEEHSRKWEEILDEAVNELDARRAG